MVSTILRALAIAASLVLLASFTFFAIDQAGGASNQAQAEVAAAGNQTVGPPIHGGGSKTGLRGGVDSVAGDLTSPLRLVGPRARPTRGARAASSSPSAC